MRIATVTADTRRRFFVTTLRSGSRKATMALKGDLASVDLAQVFQMLALNQKVGMLSIQSPDDWKALYFDQRGVALYYNEHLLLDRVLAFMVCTGELQAETVVESREHAANTGRPIVESLLASGFVTEQAFEAAFRREMEEEVYDLFFWRDARFEFFEGADSLEGREGVVNDSYFLATDSLIMEAARRIDEWSYIEQRVAGPEQVHRPVGDVTAVMDLDDTALAVLELVDGKRNVARLIEITGAPPFQVYKGLACLLEQGHIEDLLPAETVEAAAECVAEGRQQDAINLYERAISLEEGLPGTQLMVADVYEDAEEYDLAGYHLSCVAEHHAEQGDALQAVTLLRHIVEMLPTDLAARERLVELTVGSPEFKTDEFDPVAEGKVLVDLYLEIGDIDRVRRILEKLLRDNPDDIELKKSLINVHNKAGDTKRVIELYESIAADLVGKLAPIEAVKYLQKILTIDRSRQDVSDRIKFLYQMDERRRSRRRAMAALGAVCVAVVALAGVWYFYEQHARAQFVQLDVTQLIDSQDYATAEVVYSSFARSYPLTLIAADARMEVTRIQAKRLGHEAGLRAEQAAQESRRESERYEYRLIWDRHRAQFEAEDLVATVESLEAVQRMVAAVGQAEDRAWAEEVQLHKSVSDLRRYLGEAAALAGSARELMADDRWRDARDVLLELTERYEITDLAKQARIPVMLTSMPTGAVIERRGRAITEGGDPDELPLTTPAVVFFRRGEAEDLALRHDGFAPLPLTIDPCAAAVSHHVLTVIPSVTVDFSAAVQSPVAAHGGVVVAGLSGGQVGVANVEDGSGQAVIELRDLRELVGAPVVARDRLVFRVNEPQLLCYTLPSVQERYAVALGGLPIHGPVVKDGRVLVVDERGMLTCLRLDDGEQLWEVQIPGDAGGAPSLYRRHVRLGTTSGSFLMLDAIDGSVVVHHTGLPGISTAVLPSGEGSIFGTIDGLVVALDERSGEPLWQVNVGSSLREGAIGLAGRFVLAVGDLDTLVRIDRASGEVEGRFQLPGRRLSGPVTSGGRTYLTVREGVERGRPHDLLLALDVERFEVMWEFRDGGQFRAPVTTDGAAVYLPGSSAKVLRFR